MNTAFHDAFSTLKGIVASRPCLVMRRIPHPEGMEETGLLPMSLTRPASPPWTGEALGKAQGAFIRGGLG